LEVLWDRLLFLEQADSESDKSCGKHDGSHERQINYGAWFRGRGFNRTFGSRIWPLPF